MKAEEKAKELVQKYIDLDVWNHPIAIEEAQEMALIAVEEIEKQVALALDLTCGVAYELTNDCSYWQEVKQEIEKL